MSVADSVACEGAARRAFISETHSRALWFPAGPMPCVTQLKLNLHGRGPGGMQVPDDAELKHVIALAV